VPMFLTRTLRIEPQTKFQTLSIALYHKSPYLSRRTTRQVTEKQIEAWKKSPVYQGMLKAQAQRIEFAKNREANPEEFSSPPLTNRPIQFLSTNKIMEPNLPKPLPHMSDRQFWLTPLKKLWNSLNTNIFHYVRLRNMLTRKKLPKKDYTGKIMRANAEDLYLRYHKDFLAGKSENLASYCSELLTSESLKEIGKRPKVYTLEIKWDCEIKKLNLLSLRVVSIPSPISKDFVQLSYQFITKQGHSLVDRKTEQVVQQKEPETVEHYFGIEKSVEPNSKWILVEKYKPEL